MIRHVRSHVANLAAYGLQRSFGLRALSCLVALAVLSVLSAGLTADAAELELGVTSQYVYNSNFFANAGNANAVNSFQLGPTVRVSDSEGRFGYDVTYTGAYQAYVDQDGVDAWESRLRARLSYEIDRRTTIRLTNRFRDVSNLRFSRQDIELGDTALDPNQDRYFRNDLELELIRELTSLLELRLRTGHHWIDFDDNIDRNDSQAFDVGGELNYQLSTQHTVGIGAEYTYQDFEGAFSRLGSEGQYINGYLSWVWDITSSIQFRMNGGPSWIRSDEDDTRSVSQTAFVGGRVNGDLLRADFNSCAPGFNAIPPALPPVGSQLASDCDFQTTGAPAITGTNDLGGIQGFTIPIGDPRVGTASELTFFGGASVQGRIAEWVLQASYSRRQSTTSGDGLASSLDRVAIDLEFDDPNSRWSPFIAGSWDRRETLTEATFVDFVVDPGPAGEALRVSATTSIEESRSRRDNFTAIAGLRGAIDRNWSGTAEFRYRRTESRDRSISRPGVDTFFILFTVEYLYDVLQF